MYTHVHVGEWEWESYYCTANNIKASHSIIRCVPYARRVERCMVACAYYKPTPVIFIARRRERKRAFTLAARSTWVCIQLALVSRQQWKRLRIEIYYISSAAPGLLKSPALFRFLLFYLFSGLALHSAVFYFVNSYRYSELVYSVSPPGTSFYFATLYAGLRLRLGLRLLNTGIHNLREFEYIYSPHVECMRRWPRLLLLGDGYMESGSGRKGSFVFLFFTAFDRVPVHKLIHELFFFIDKYTR